MSTPILGIDIAKQRVEVVLLVDGKVKNRSFKNAPFVQRSTRLMQVLLRVFVWP